MDARPAIPSLTSLRFFAALLVVIFHYNLGNPIFPAALAGLGYEAVTFFFVLSGFILTYVHVRGSPTPKLNITGREFLIARIIRITPGYLVGLAISLPFFVATSRHMETSLFLSGLVLVPIMGQAWFPPAAMLWNAPAWSLSNELFFYAAYPLLWRMIRATSPIVLLGIAFATILFAEVLRAILGMEGEAWHNFRAYFPLMNLPQFVLGIALAGAFIYGRRWSPRHHEVALTIGLCVFAASVIARPFAPWLGNPAILSIEFGLIIFGAAGATGLLSDLLSAKVLVLLGDASYAVYIIHLPLWLWWDRLRLPVPAAIDFAIYLIATIIGAICVLLLIERPSRRWLRQQLNQSSDYRRWSRCRTDMASR